MRSVDFDVCYPATDQEYESMGKNAVVMLTASSVSSSELPLEAAYVRMNGIRVPLQRLAVSTQARRSKRDRTRT